jgi:hypothetical protein
MNNHNVPEQYPKYPHLQGDLEGKARNYLYAKAQQKYKDLASSPTVRALHEQMIGHYNNLLGLVKRDGKLMPAHFDEAVGGSDKAMSASLRNMVTDLHMKPS